MVLPSPTHLDDDADQPAVLPDVDQVAAPAHDDRHPAETHVRCQHDDVVHAGEFDAAAARQHDALADADAANVGGIGERHLGDVGAAHRAQHRRIARRDVSTERRHCGGELLQATDGGVARRELVALVRGQLGEPDHRSPLGGNLTRRGEGRRAGGWRGRLWKQPAPHDPQALAGPPPQILADPSGDAGPFLWDVHLASHATRANAMGRNHKTGPSRAAIVLSGSLRLRRASRRLAPVRAPPRRFAPVHVRRRCAISSPCRACGAHAPRSSGSHSEGRPWRDR